MSLFKTISTYLLIVLISISLTACSDNSDSSNTQKLSETVPSIRSFVSHIDVNATASTVNTVLGNIEVITEGGSNIEGYTLEGVGRSNFTISKNGELAIGSHASAIKYDLQVTARNTNGDSQSQSVIIEVTTLDQPVLQDIILDTDNAYWSLHSGLELVRDGNASIKAIEIIGNNSENISITSAGVINLSNSYLSVGRHYYYVRAVNTQGIIGPYTSLIINVKEYYYTDHSGDINNPSASLNLTAGTTSDSLYANMDFDYDEDAFRINTDTNSTLYFLLTSYSEYNYASNSSDSINFYDSSHNYIETYHSSGNTSFTVEAGTYYIMISGASDSYSIQVYK